MLSEFAPDIFVHDARKRFCGFMIPRCMTVVRLGGDRLLVHSPNTLTPENLQNYIDAGAKIMAVFRWQDLSEELLTQLEPSLRATQDIQWDKQALRIYVFE